MGIPHLAVCSRCKKPNRILNFNRLTIANCQNCKEALPLLSDPFLFQSVFDHHLLSVIGMGGMGRVYLAQNVKLKTFVAAKAQLHREATKEQRERFWNEAKILKDFDHPNIIRFVGAVETELGSFLFMEYFPGFKLSQLVVSQSPLSYPYLLKIFKEICLALKHVHEQGYIHRDLKPNNVLIGEKDTIRLIDFGISIRKGMELNETKAIGTISYMAPEQLFGKKIDEQSDIYSLGSIFFFMLTAQKPFEGATSPYLMKQQFQDNLSGLLKPEHQFPKPLVTLLEKMTAPEKEKRFGSVQEIIDFIEKLSLERTPGQSKNWLKQKVSRTDLKIPTSTASGSWAAIPLPEYSKRKQILALLLLVFVVASIFIMFENYFPSNPNPKLPHNNGLPKEISTNEKTLNNPQKISLISQLEKKPGVELLEKFLEDYLAWAPVKEKKVRLRIAFLQKKIMPFLLQILKEDLSPKAQEGLNILLGRFEFDSPPRELLEFILTPNFPIKNRQFLFNWIITEEKFHFFYEYHRNPFLAELLSWIPKKREVLLESLIKRTRASELFDFFQHLSEQEKLSLEIFASQFEGKLKDKICQKYKKVPLDFLLLQQKFHEKENWELTLSFLLKLGTEESIEALFKLLLQTPLQSEKGQVLLTSLESLEVQVDLDLAPFKLLLKENVLELEDQKLLLEVIRKLTGFDLSFVLQIESEFLRIKNLKGSIGFKVIWHQELFGFVLASLSKNIAFQVFFFEKLRKEINPRIDLVPALEKSRTNPVFFQELLFSWVLAKYPEVKSLLEAQVPIKLKETLPLNQYREGLENLTGTIYELLESANIPSLHPKIIYYKKRFFVRKMVALTEKQKIVGAYYGLIDLFLLFLPESEQIKYRSLLKEMDPLCETVDEQILLALKILTELANSFLSQEKYQLEIFPKKE